MSDANRTPNAVTIVIADDHQIFRDGLHRLLEIEGDMQVIGEAADAEQALALTRTLHPDVLLLDLAMPRVSGLEALRELSEEREAPTRVIMLTAAIDRVDIVKALQLGARGVVLKESATALLMKGIRAVMNGEYWIGREAVTDLVFALRTVRGESDRTEAPVDHGLTDRELQITRLVVAAAGNREIAEKLGISEKTVKHHMTNIFNKLGVSSRLELALFAINNDVGIS